MRFIHLTILILILAGCSKISDVVPPPTLKAHLPTRYIVKYKQGATVGLLPIRTIYTAAMKQHKASPLYIVETTDPDSYKKNPSVEYIEQDIIIHSDGYVSNDPQLPNQWGIANIGAETAWVAGNIGDHNIAVGVVDESIFFDHPELCPNKWINPGEIAGNGIDDDNNGYIDDVNGYDFKNNTGTVYNGVDKHASHVMGILDARGGNASDIAGVAWKATVINAKFLEGTGYLSDAIRAYDYITDLKTRYNLNIVAINDSWGGAGTSQSLLDAFTRAGQAGILSVVAAGNNATDDNTTSFIPASFSSIIPDYVITVAAIDVNNNLASFSNWGSQTVDIGAPGVNILSTVPTLSGYTPTLAYYSGTSMATPFVTGGVILYRTGNPTATPRQTKDAIINAGISTGSLEGKTISGKRLNVSSFTYQSPSYITNDCATIIPPETIPPTIPSYYRINSFNGNLAYPDFGNSTDASGVSYYQMRFSIHSDMSNYWISNWNSPTGINGAVVGVGTFATGSTYFTNVRAYDIYNNEGLPTTTFSFVQGGTAPPPPTDITPPIVNIITPPDGYQIPTPPGKGNKPVIVNITISAMDNVAVTLRQILIDGVVVSTNSNTYSWNTKNVSRGAHIITAKAFDAANNQSMKSITVYK